MAANIILTHMLSRPIEFPEGNEIKELEFREPTAKDIVTVGHPVMVRNLGGEDTDVTFHELKMTAMMSTLCSLPPSALNGMSTNDWTQIAWGLAPFFVPMDRPT